MINCSNCECEFTSYFFYVAECEYNCAASFCGGTLLSTDTVLTAAHCGDDKDLDEWKVVVGVHNWDSWQPEMDHTPCKRIPHPGYDGIEDYLDNDFAIVKLKDAVTYSPSVRPACLPSPYTDYDNVSATVSGWGRLAAEAFETPKILQKVDN